MTTATYRLLLCKAGFHSWTAWRRRKRTPAESLTQHSRCRRCGKERARDVVAPRIDRSLVSLALRDKQDAEQSYAARRTV
jgi:hypothetical protein